MSTRSSKRDRARREIERGWGDTPVVDAKDNVRIFITPEDLNGAITNHPAQCVLARACQRMFGTDKVLFFKRTAFVGLPDELGIERVERFMLGETVREVIRTFDRGEPIIPHAGVMLLAPSPSEKLEAKVRQNHTPAARRRARQRQQRRTERARAERATRAALEGEDAALEGEDAALEPETPCCGPREPRSEYSPFRDEPILVDLKARSGSGVVNWLRKRAGRGRPSAAATGSQPRMK
jgi:hypothetical protein